MKYGVTQWSFPGHGIYAARYVAQAGFDGMQLDLGGVEDGFYLCEKKIRQAYLEDAEKYGLEYPSVVMFDLMFHGFMGSKGGNDYKAAVGSQDMVVEAVDAMGIAYVVAPLFFQSQIRTDADYERAVEYMKSLCVKARKYGIRVGSETSLSGPRQIKFMEDVGESNLDCYFDSYNYLWYEGHSQTESLETLYPYLGNELHLCDGSGPEAEGGANGEMPLGEGTGSFLEQMDILRRNKYDGWLILENIYWKKPLCEMGMDPFDHAEKELEYVKKLVSEW